MFLIPAEKGSRENERREICIRYKKEASLRENSGLLGGKYTIARLGIFDFNKFDREKGVLLNADLCSRTLCLIAKEHVNLFSCIYLISLQKRLCRIRICGADSYTCRFVNVDQHLKKFFFLLTLCLEPNREI